MSDDRPAPPPASPRPTAAQQREARLAAALRENLRRRKAQSRSRAEEAPPAKPEPEAG